MQKIDTLIKRIGEMLNSPEIENDPNGMEKFMALHKELLKEKGYEIKETFCKCCGEKVDEPKQEDGIRLALEDKMFKVKYVCPICSTETEMSTVSKACPTDKPILN
jgi:hypothetical protein